MALPTRHGYLRRRARWIRLVMWIEWIIAAALGTAHDPLLGALVVGGVIAGYVYSGWKPKEGEHGRSRLKDLHGLKALLIACSVVGLGVAGSVGFGELGMINALRLVPTLGWISVAGVWCIVLGDAVVCDLDDVESDGTFLIQSLPVMIGKRAAGVIAGLMLALGGTMVVLSGYWEGSGAGSVGDRMFFAATVALSGIGIMRLHHRRDWIDGRMLVLVQFTLWIAG